MRVELRLRLLSDGGEKFFGEGPYRLLRGVERLGSLRAAANELGMAYSKASRIVHRAERELGFALTEKRIGGPDGGGSRLTPQARELLHRYEALRAACEAAMQEHFARSFGDFPPAAAQSPEAQIHPAGGQCCLACSSPSHTSEAQIRPVDGQEYPPSPVPSLPLEAQIRSANERGRSHSARSSTSQSPETQNRPAGGRGRLASSAPFLPSEARSSRQAPAGAGSDGRAATPVEQGERPALGCAVLAAGRGERFGGGKLLAMLGGRSVLARMLEALPRERFARVVAVTSDPAVSALCRAAGVEVREYPGGPLSDSIREALAAMDGTDGCMFVNGDQPLLRPASLRRLAEAFADDPACAYRLSHGGTAASPVIIPAAAYPALRSLMGESGGMAALYGGSWEIRAVEAEDPSELWDIDDNSALQMAEEWLRGNAE